MKDCNQKSWKFEILYQIQTHGLTGRALSTRNFFLKMKQLIVSVTSRKIVRKKITAKSASKKCMLHHNNTLGSSFPIVARQMRWQSLPTLPTYSPDLAVANFFLYPKMDRFMKGEKFVDFGKIKKFRKSWKTFWEKIFPSSFLQWKWRWKSVLLAKKNSNDNGGEDVA